MFAVVLKNTIFILFIVCIGYFLIDNHLNELENESKNCNKNNDALNRTVPKKPVPESKSILKDIITSVQKESEPLEVKTISLGKTLNCFAIFFLAVSIATLAFLPN